MNLVKFGSHGNIESNILNAKMHQYETGWAEFLPTQDSNAPPARANDSGRVSLNNWGNCDGRPEGARPPTAGSEMREFTSRVESGRVLPPFENLRERG